MPQHRHTADDYPLGHDEADVIDLGKASRERPRRTELPIELFLLSDEGKLEMDALYTSVDSSGRIVRTISTKIDEMMQKMIDDNSPDIYSLFLHDDGAVGLTRLELIDLYKTNPLINASLQASSIKHHDGDFKAQEMFTYARRIFMNMVRYEWLTRTYDPQDPRWESRAMRLGNYDGGELHANLQPGFNRAVIIPRNHTPSDYLPRRST